MIRDPKRLVDGQLEFSRGCDTGRAPDRIAPNQVALLVNGSCRDDIIKQRPGFRQIALTFTNEDTQTAFEEGYFQGASPFIVPKTDPVLHVGISGKLFRVNLVTKAVEELALPDANPTNKPIIWLEQVQNEHVYQDGESIPLIIGTGSVVRSDVMGAGGVIDGKPKRQVPTGQSMAYANGRLTVCLADGVSFLMGDIVGGPTGPTYFTENQFVAGGGDFKVPSNLGNITSIQALANLDTSLGQGPVQVFTSEGGFSCNAPTDRTTWFNLSYPLNSVSLFNQGPAGDYSVVTVNGDKWYRSDDGIRSFIMARRDFGMWGNTAMSNEVSKFIDSDSQDLLDRASGALFNNWLLQTCKPQLDRDRGVFHQGLVVLDFTPLTAMLQREPPAWEGMWTGLNFMQLHTVKVQGKSRCFIIALSDDRKIQLWEIDTKLNVDLESDGTETRIRRAIEFARLSFGNSKELKRLDAFDLWASNYQGTVDFILFYRPDQYACWFAWQAWQECVNMCASATDGACMVGDDMNVQPQYRPRTSAQRPPNACGTGTGMPTDYGYQFQARLEITGTCDVQGYRLIATRVDEDVWGPCPPVIVTECPKEICCPPYDVPPAPESSRIGFYVPSEDPTDGEPEVPPPAAPPEPPSIPGPDDPFVTLGPTALTWQPFFEDDLGNSRPLGYEPTGSPPADLNPGILEQWKAAVLEKFAESGIAYSSAQLYWQYSSGDGQLRYNPNMFFTGLYFTAAWKQEIWVEYLT
jgi:hypothetical protein